MSFQFQIPSALYQCQISQLPKEIPQKEITKTIPSKKIPALEISAKTQQTLLVSLQLRGHPRCPT